MSHTIDIRDARTSLSKLVHDLETGVAREFIIARNGRPAARVIPLQTTTTDRARRIGVAKGRFTVPGDIERTATELARLFATD